MPILPVCESVICLAIALMGITEQLRPPPIEQMPLFLSWYDPKLCLPENGGVMTNCDSQPTHMAGGTPVTEEIYGYAAACLTEWFDKRITIPGLGERHCLDTGSRITVVFRLVYTPQGFRWLWVIVIDILHPFRSPPDWQYSLVYGWSLN